MSTTIQISDDVRKTLEMRKLFDRETCNDVIERMIEDDLELSEQTKRDLMEREKNPKLISHEEVGKRLGFNV